jgi:hypothetical protein
MTNTAIQVKAKVLTLIERFGKLTEQATKDVIDAFVEDVIVEIVTQGQIMTPRLTEMIVDTFLVSQEDVSQFISDLSTFVKSLHEPLINEDYFNSKDFNDDIDLTIAPDDELGQLLWLAVDKWCQSKGIEKLNTVLLSR